MYALGLVVIFFYVYVKLAKCMDSFFYEMKGL